MNRSLAALALVASVAAAPASLRAQSFDFESVPAGTTTPFSVTQGGLTATFTALNPAAPFSVVALASNFAPNISGQSLQQPAGFGGLGISFSSTLSLLNFAFATNGASTLFVQAFLGATSVGNAFFSSVSDPNFAFPGGIATFSGSAFDRVAITTQNPETQFLVDNLTARQVTQVVPEPATVALLGAGVVALGVGGAWRRRRAA